MRGLPRLPPAARIAGIALVALACVIAGFALGTRVAPTSYTQTDLGRVAFRVAPSLTGAATAVIPVADWGFRADAFDAPFELRSELRSLERTALTSAAGGDLAVLAAAEEQLESGARSAVLGAFAWGAGGALVALVIATLIWRRLRPRWALLALGGAVTVLGAGASLALADATFDAAAFEQPTYFAKGEELRRILEVAEDERVRSAYGSEFASVLRSVSAVLAGPQEPGTPTRTVYLGSDLHANALVVAPLAEAVGNAPFILAGDFGQRGGAAEARLLAPRVAALGNGVIATSGNHDTSGLMDALAARGVTTLGDAGAAAPEVASVAGLQVAGFPDPFEWTGDGDPESRPITFDDLPEPETAAADEVERLVAGFRGLRPAPDVAVVHQSGLAEALAERLHDDGYGRALVIATGHDHRQRIERYGPITIVNGGSIGAGGVFEAGRAPIGFAELHFAAGAPVLRSVDLIAIEPFSGQAQASRVVIGSLCPAEERCSYEPPAPGGSVLDEGDGR